MANKKVFNMDIAVQLIRKGHDLQTTKRNNRNPDLTVFVFFETEQLLQDLNELIKK